MSSINQKRKIVSIELSKDKKEVTYTYEDEPVELFVVRKYNNSDDIPLRYIEEGGRKRTIIEKADFHNIIIGINKQIIENDDTSKTQLFKNCIFFIPITINEKIFKLDKSDKLNYLEKLDEKERTEFLTKRPTRESTQSKENSSKKISQEIFKMINFNNTIFTKKVDFNVLTFNADMDFSRTLFLQNVSFNNIIFEKKANFHDTYFSTASFIDTVFQEEVSFQNSTFGVVLFEETTFSKKANFSNAKFKHQANFSNSHIKNFLFMAVTMEKTCTFNLKLTQIDKINFEGTNFKNIMSNRETWLKMKQCAIKNDDHIGSLEFYANEMEAYKNSLLDEKKVSLKEKVKSMCSYTKQLQINVEGKIQNCWQYIKSNDKGEKFKLFLEKIITNILNFSIDKFILSFEEKVSNFGTNPITPLLWIFFITFICTWLLYDSNSFQVFLHLLNPLTKFNDLKYVLECDTSIWNHSIFLVHKILLAIFIYEAIKSFRKYSRKL